MLSPGRCDRYLPAWMYMCFAMFPQLQMTFSSGVSVDISEDMQRLSQQKEIIITIIQCGSCRAGGSLRALGGLAALGTHFPPLASLSSPSALLSLPSNHFLPPQDDDDDDDEEGEE